MPWINIVNWNPPNDADTGRGDVDQVEMYSPQVKEKTKKKTDGLDDTPGYTFRHATNSPWRTLIAFSSDEFVLTTNPPSRRRSITPNIQEEKCKNGTSVRLVHPFAYSSFEAKQNACPGVAVPSFRSALSRGTHFSPSIRRNCIPLHAGDGEHH